MAKISLIKRKSKLSTPRLVSARSIILSPALRHPVPAHPHHRSYRKKREDPILYRSQSALWQGARRQTPHGPSVHPALQRRWWAPRPERMRQTRHDRGTSSEYPSLDRCARPPLEPYRSSRRSSPRPPAPACPSPLSPPQPAPLFSALHYAC